MRSNFLNTAQQSVALIERIGADNIFIHLDTYHMNIEEVGMAKRFADAGEHMGYIYLSESSRGVPGRGRWVGSAALRNSSPSGKMAL